MTGENNQGIICFSVYSASQRAQRTQSSGVNNEKRKRRGTGDTKLF